MTPVGAIEGLLSGAPAITRIGVPAQQPLAPPVASFGSLLAQGMQGVEQKLGTAETLVQRFTLDQGVAIHQVTFAMEEARMAVELAMQVRSRLLDGYREIMNMCPSSEHLAQLAA